MSRLLVLAVCAAGCSSPAIAPDATVDAPELGDATGRDAPARDVGLDARDDPPDAFVAPVDAGPADGGPCEIVPNGGCPTGHACYFDYVPGSPMRVRRCLPEGAGLEGEECSAAAGVNACAAGLYCESGSPQVCNRYCSRDPGVCPTDPTRGCISVSSFEPAYGVCEPIE